MQIIERLSNQDYVANEKELGVREQSKASVNRMFTVYAYFCIYSFIGWIWETTITSIDTGSLQKRGFLDVPILPIYGFAITFVILLFYNKGLSVPKLFVLSSLLTTMQEFLTSYVLEKMFHQVWWDYSQMRFQIQGRVCLIGAIIFGTACVIIVQYVHPRIEKLVNHFFLQEKSKVICTVSFAIIIIDTVLKSFQLLH